METPAADTTTTTTTPTPVEYPLPLPVVFKSVNTLPGFAGRLPDQEYGCHHFTLNYYKPDLQQAAKAGIYELVSLNNSDNVIKLYQSGMRTLVNNLGQAFEAVKHLEWNNEDTYEVSVLSSNETVSTRLVLVNFQNTSSVYLKMYRKDDNGLIYPTRKSIKFSELDDAVALAEFIKGKR
jgi:hypothetical protein